jgi:type IX secretion system PorP/SprF family membrane protein
VFRAQWTELEGNPVTQNVSVHMPLYILSGGIGINVENDELGPEQWTTGTIAYNFQKEIGSNVLAIGASGGIVQRTIDGSQLRTPEGQYVEPGSINHNDPILPLSSVSAMVPTFNAGVYLMNEWMEAGVSVRNITESAAEFDNFNLALKRNFAVNLGFHFDLSQTLSVHPSALLRSDLTQTQADFSVIMRYNNNIFGGASFRGYNTNSADAVAILAGFKLSEKLTLAYGYDITLSDLNLVSNGSHEISLNFNLNKRIGAGRPPAIIYNPRSL